MRCGLRRTKRRICVPRSAARRHPRYRSASTSKAKAAEGVAAYGLERNPLSTVASWWHTDADLGREVETFNDMTKSRNFGFLDYQDTVASLRDAFDRLRADRIAP